MDGELLRVTGLTGIDLSLPVAGPGTRSYAFIIDWHIRILLAAAWALAVWLVGGELGHLGAKDAARALFVSLMLWPALLVYFLYHPVLEVLMRGRTPGKRIAGVRLVTRNGGVPGIGAILARNIFRLIDCLPFVYLVGLSCCMLSAQRLRIGDMAAGTVLIVDATSTQALAQLPALVARTGLDASLLELLRELLERWASMDAPHRDAIARSLLGRAQPNASSTALAALNDTQLHQRLRQLLSAPS